MDMSGSLVFQAMAADLCIKQVHLTKPSALQLHNV